MNPITEGLFIGVGSAIVIGLLTWLAASFMRLWHTPKRLDRIETLLPPLVRAVLCVLKNQKSGACNGTTDESIAELNELLTNQAVSQKEMR